MSDILEVAALAGVSPATVSRAITAPEKLRAETLARVQDAIYRLNYKPNARAQGLRRQRSGTIMVVVNDLHNPFIASVVRAIEDRAQDLDLSVLIGDSQRVSARELAYGEMAARGVADGIIQLGPRLPLASERDLERCPVVSVLDCFDHPAVPTVQVDNQAAARCVIEYLFGLGHRRIALITGPETSTQSRDRLGGAQSAFAMLGGRPDDLLLGTGDYSAIGGYRVTIRLLDGAMPGPTALFCFNDLMAIGAIKAVMDAGMRVPTDMSVVGFDDIDVARFLNPALTSVLQPAQEIGAMAVDILAARMADRGSPVASGSIAFTLKPRGSSGSAPDA